MPDKPYYPCPNLPLVDEIPDSVDFVKSASSTLCKFFRIQINKKNH
jgi:hypothetical protein